MYTYTSTVVWLEVLARGRVRLCSHTIRNIKASNILEASRIALAPHVGKICPSVSRIWYNWPQEAR